MGPWVLINARWYKNTIEKIASFLVLINQLPNTKRTHALKPTRIVGLFTASTKYRIE